uniref:OCIA domain-containing protein 1 n=1 Tax=Oreochromis niloticus TaxID=8128 RepID=I3KNG9_ORENI
MSSSTTGFPGERQHQPAQTPLNIDYIPTEEERRVLRECNQESFFYRSVPFSVISMAITQALVARVAGFCGYLAGKLSYMKTCQEKFKRLENSPLGEIIRQRSGLPPLKSQGPQSELGDPDSQSFEPIFQPAEASSHTYSKDYGYGYSPDPPAQMDRGDDFSAPVQSYVEEEEPKRTSILYEDLRLKNRENYEVTLTQKADALLKTPPAKEVERPKKEVKKNVYGDAWEE